MTALFSAEAADYRHVRAQFPGAPGTLLGFGPFSQGEAGEDDRSVGLGRLPQVPAVGHPGKVFVKSGGPGQDGPHPAVPEVGGELSSSLEHPRIEIGKNTVEIEEKAEVRLHEPIVIRKAPGLNRDPVTSDSEEAGLAKEDRVW